MARRWSKVLEQIRRHSLEKEVSRPATLCHAVSSSVSPLSWASHLCLHLPGGNSTTGVGRYHSCRTPIAVTVFSCSGVQGGYDIDNAPFFSFHLDLARMGDGLIEIVVGRRRPWISCYERTSQQQSALYE